MNLTRAKFDELTAHLVERTAGPVNSALNDAGMTASEIKQSIISWWFYTYPSRTGQSTAVNRKRTIQRNQPRRMCSDRSFCSGW